MPHISNKKLKEETVQELENYILTIIKNTDSKTRTHILNELLTTTEKIMIAKRIGMIFMLKKRVGTHVISRTLGVSPSTAERFQNAMNFGKYKRTAQWVWEESSEGRFDKFMKSLVSLAFTGRTHSFKKFVDRM